MVGYKLNNSYLSQCVAVQKCQLHMNSVHFRGNRIVVLLAGHSSILVTSATLLTKKKRCTLIESISTSQTGQITDPFDVHNATLPVG